MNFYFKKIKLIHYFILTVFSFYINFYFANKGLYPIDTFSFFDSGYLITQGYHPIKDFWVISGIVIDYLQAFFFLIFGYNWNAYVFHASFFNVLLCIFFLFFLNNFNKKPHLNLFLSLSVAVLCYPVSGTPFPYQHSYILSLISLIVFYLAVSKEERKYWIILPIIMFLSFFSMQMPAGLINLLLIVFTSYYFLKFNNKPIFHFSIGILISITIMLIYFVTVKVDIKSFITQIILFPLSIGESRITGDLSSYASANLFKKLTFRGTVGHFKFINIILIANIITILISIRRGAKFFDDKKIFLNLLIFLSGVSFIFHQLITANQTFIFSLIPILSGFFIIQIKELFSIDNKKFYYLIVFFILFVTLKYNDVYNSKRKFMDLQNVNLSKSIDASKINNKFNKLNWITPFYFRENPEQEIEFLKETISLISSENNNFILITNYQFFSVILQKKINILSRWYFASNNTIPTTYDNKYYKYYLNRINNIIENREIKKIFILETYPNELDFINFKDYLKEKCFKKNKINEIFYSLTINSC